jgi:hypothetical protein
MDMIDPLDTLVKPKVATFKDVVHDPVHGDIRVFLIGIGLDLYRQSRGIGLIVGRRCGIIIAGITEDDGAIVEIDTISAIMTRGELANAVTDNN